MLLTCKSMHMPTTDIFMNTSWCITKISDSTKTVYTHMPIIKLKRHPLKETLI